MTEPTFWCEPSSVGDLYVGGADLLGQELAVLFGKGWHCHLTAGEAARLSEILRDISEAILGGAA